MSCVEMSDRDPGSGIVDMKLEFLVLPVSDGERAKRLYETLRARLDADWCSNS